MIKTVIVCRSSVPRGSQFSRLQTDDVQEKMSEHIFAPNGGYCLYYPSTIFGNVHCFQNWAISLGYSPVSARVYLVM